MDTPSHDIPIEELLAHEGWLRRVVADLVDDHLVDDVLQETWVAALATRGIRHPRAWLRRVAQNVAAVRRRGEARRRQREASVARDEALPSTDAMVARLDAHQRLAQAVAELEEPYRTAVLLRYFEDLAPREIARRLGVPASTVRTHIERGLERVRGRLGSDGDVRALAVLILTPRVGEPIAPLTVTGRGLELAAGVLAMSVQYKLLSVAIVVAMLTPLAFWSLGGSGSLAIETAPPPAVTVESAAATTEPDVAVETRLDVADPDTVAAVIPPMRGRVVDATGTPVAGVALEYRPTVSEIGSSLFSGVVPAGASGAVDLGVSDALGRLAFEGDGDFGQLHAKEPYVTVQFHVPRLADRVEDEGLVIVARRGTARGRVVDADGEPLEGVAVMPKVASLFDYPDPLDHVRRLGIEHVVTGPDGRFEFEVVPRLREFEALFSKTGYAALIERDLARGEEVVVTLQKRSTEGYEVRGTVVDLDGQPVRGATVLLHQEMAVSDGRGRFRISSRYLDGSSLFGAARPGFQPAVRPDVVERLLAGEELEGVQLQIGEPALTVGGRVVDQDGRALEGCTLCVLDGVPVQNFMTIEDFIGGRAVGLRNEHGFAMKVDAVSAADGTFEIDGLADRAYRVRVYDPETLVSRTVTAAPGARDLVVALDKKGRRTFRGVVRTRGGVALAGVSVYWSLKTYESSGRTLQATGESSETDAQGLFEIHNVPNGDATLVVSGRDFVDEEVDLTELDSAKALVITPWAQCRVQVRLAMQGATRVQFLDAQGAALEVSQTSGPISYSGDGWDLENGRTPTVEVSQAAVALVVLSEGTEIARHPITLRAEGVETLQF